MSERFDRIRAVERPQSLENRTSRLSIFFELELRKNRLNDDRIAKVLRDLQRRPS